MELSINFTDWGPCEKCHKETLISRNGVCRSCLEKILQLRGVEKLREKRFKELTQSENGVIRETSRQMLFQTHQADSTESLSWKRITEERDRSKILKAAQREKALAVIAATAQQLADARNIDPIRISLVEVNDELIRWLAKNPQDMMELSPRKFEEVVAEILRDQGHTVELTPETRDGGRDIIVVMKTSIGEMLLIVECKRWSPPAKVGIEVIERFLYTLRLKDKANCGLIATTTEFSSEASKIAKEQKFLLKLADFNKLHEMAQQYGVWHQTENSNIWVPNYTSL